MRQIANAVENDVFDREGGCIGWLQWSIPAPTQLRKPSLRVSDKEPRAKLNALGLAIGAGAWWASFVPCPVATAVALVRVRIEEED